MGMGRGEVVGWAVVGWVWVGIGLESIVCLLEVDLYVLDEVIDLAGAV